MLTKEPLKEILTSTRAVWDRAEIRPVVRENFDKVLKCRTAALGSNVYASENEQKVVHHTCKSRACPSCGHRATTLWQREQWASLPDIPYTGVVFTMPDILWPFFRENRHLLNDLPALGAAVIQHWAKEEYGARVMIMVVRHSFGRHLNFNPHLHIMVSAAGLRDAEAKGVSDIRFDRKVLMAKWRYAIVSYLRAALNRGLLKSDIPAKRLKAELTKQYERWWNIHIHHCVSKEHFLRYAARYVRRPPIAQYRFVENNEGEVQFRSKDHKLKREVLTRYSPEDFIEALSHHVHDHYRHAIRYFGLSAPRTKHDTSNAILAMTSQSKRPRPARLSWALSIERSFGVNPLIDGAGNRMRLIARTPSLS